MIKIKEAVVVEGRYDKNALSQVVDTAIFVTDGFGIFHDSQQLALLRSVAKIRGLIVFTDPDGAGLVIRNYLKSAIEPQYLKHAYIPEIFGKERRKLKAGKEGKLGVEGMKPETLVEALRRSGAVFDDGACVQPSEITKQDMVLLGLSGGPNSSYLRKQLLKKLELPEHLSCNALLQAAQILYTPEEFRKIVESLE